MNDMYFDEEKNEVVVTLRATLDEFNLHNGGYISVDEDGGIYFSERKPTMNDNYWTNHGEGYALWVNNWKSLIMKLPNKELTDEELDTKLSKKLKQLSKEEKMNFLKEIS